MVLEPVDWALVAGFFAMSLGVGMAVARRAGSSASEYFLSGRNMPWWLLGFSMVATTFSTDTPNLVTDFVRQRGVAGNWSWWAFLLTGMLTVFVYARLWRRSGVMTDVEFYELRYSGRAAAFLRGFRALYLGVFFNVMIMATVTLAAIKIGGVMLGLSAVKTVVVAVAVTVAYSALGGLRSVLLTDFVLFIVAMAGSVAAAVVSLGHERVGGLAGLLASPAVQGKLSFLPDFHDSGAVVTVLLIPLAVQWWSVWYPGAEPGGGGYIAQRMLAARDERHAVGATLFFNAAHYALRPWPWILVALCSLVVFPDLESLRAAFPGVDPRVVRDDLAYPAMLTFLPPGLLGLVVASLVAAYMSTISTHLNWGASYVVNDFYRRFVRPRAGQRELVWVGRGCTVVMMGIAGAVALCLESAVKAFGILLQIGAGTGLLFLLRWFWWRINAASEIAAMVVSFVVAVAFETFARDAVGPPVKLVAGVGITTAAWLSVAYLTRPTSQETLRRFYRLVRPGGPGWRAVRARALREGDPLDDASGGGWAVPRGIACMCAGCFAVYGTLFATGYWIYGNPVPASILTAAALAGTAFLWRSWGTGTA